MKKITILCLFLIAIQLIVGCSDKARAVSNNSNANIQNLIENSSMELADIDNSNIPTNWTHNCWGNNSAEFTYLDYGHFGDRSLNVDIKNYNNGDAKWLFDPVNLESGDYLFSNYYCSDVDTRVVTAFTTLSGDTKYVDLPIAFANTNWTKYEAVFTMPKYAESVSIYHLLSNDGYLTIDDYQLTPYKYEGFDKGMITITFDDGWEENTQTALPILQEFGFKTNQFYATTYIENPMVSNPKKYIQLFIDDGHEIGSHSVTHPYLTAISEQEVTNELADSKSFLEDYLNIEINYFATPYGDYNAEVKDEIMTYYSAHRTATDFGYNSKDNLDVSILKSQSILCNTSLREFDGWVKKAKEEKLWLILLYHRVTDRPHQYDISTDKFYQQMQAIQDSGLPVVTFTEAFDIIGSNHK